MKTEKLNGKKNNVEEEVEFSTQKIEINNNHNSLGLKPSTKLHNGHYEILDCLGEPGGFGITYLGQDYKLNTKVAIKEYFPRTYANRDQNKTIVPTNTKEDKADFKWGYEAFKKEAQTIANLEKHPNVIDVKNLFEENGTVYFVMSYAEGVDLETYLKKNHPLIQKDIEEIIFPFLEGVKHIHQSNLLHRDIKLANVLITKNKQPILIDFGTARNELNQKSKKMTSIYTEGYAALEQQTQNTEGPYTDIYAIGMLMYALVNGITDTELLPSSIKRFEALHSKKASLLNFPKDKRFTPNFINTIKKALEIRKEDRPQTIEELINLLKKDRESKETKKPFVLVTFLSIPVILLSIWLLLPTPQSTIESPQKTPIKDIQTTTPNEPLKVEHKKEITNPVHHLKQAEQELSLGNIDKALYHLKKDPSSKTPKGALRIAELYHANKSEYTNTIKWYEKAEKLGYTKAKYPLAVLYCQQGNFQKFTNSKDIFTYANDSRKEFKYDIALCYNELGNMKEAKKWFEASASMGYDPAKKSLYILLVQEFGYSNEKAKKLIKQLHK